MYTIGEFSQKAGISRRAIRLYEEKGIMRPSYRGENGYRYYSENQLDELFKIQSLRRLGFSLAEVKTVFELDEMDLKSDLKKKLEEVRREVGQLQTREYEILKLLSVTKKINDGAKVSSEERRMYMDAMKGQIIESINNRTGSVSQKHLDFIERDKGIFDTEEKQKFLEVVKECIEFARQRNLTLGPGRGSSPASITLFGVGFSGIDPTKYNLLPERLLKDGPDLHIDVEYEGGQEFVDFCRDKSKNLQYGQINAFKMPLLNIIKNVHRRLGKEIDYDSILDDSETVLKNIQNGDIEKIFCLDKSQDALVMKYENLFEEFKTTDKLKSFLKTQKIYSFLDVLNIISVWRPNAQEKVERMYRYRDAKSNDLSYAFLSPVIQEYLRPNFGQIIYHEDIMRILKEYTNWDLDKCSLFRWSLFKGIESSQDLDSLRAQAPKRVYDLVIKECKWTFCKSHTIAFSQLIKKTAVLQSQYRKIYFEEIEKWENQFGFKWDDIGIKMKGVSLLQH